MNELVEWELPIARENKKIMPCLSVLKLSKCPMMRALPGLGTLESLESLTVERLPWIKQVGLEFLGISATDEFGGGEGEKPIVPNLRNLCSAERNGSDKRGGGSSSSSSYVPKPSILFPKLTQLKFWNMDEWEVWILPPFQEDIQIMPRLKELEFFHCQKLRALLDLTRFKSLEILNISWMDGLVELEREEGISFPGLRELALRGCTNLRAIPGYLFPHTLRKFSINGCPQLRGVQPCLPPLLESLELWFDVGVFSESLPIAEEEENNNNYPNLIDVKIGHSKHPSLPKGFNHLTSIQYLRFYECDFLDFDLNELKHLTMLQYLTILDCPILAKRFHSPGDDWMTFLSHVPFIYIDNDYIKQESRTR